ncbi:MAG: GlmU family protein [Weeksellaceae bacterium]|jgi:UDP-N-acetylglucosamine diphosphorylase/glucosamine-1-phosphate N-acetyltransferase|nr:GlmU family protein [Weeksellaceae bacterium]
MNIILFDGIEWENLRPLTLTKPFAELRMGIFTFRERWEQLIRGNYSYLTRDYLSEKYPLHTEKINLFINPAFFPSHLIKECVEKLKEGETLWHNAQLIAGKLTLEDFHKADSLTGKQEFEGGFVKINRSWDLFQYNSYALKSDYDFITKGRVSQKISSTNGVLNAKNIFIEEGATVEFSILNAKEGPIYIGKNAEVMEGSMLRGGLALCEEAKINMGAKIYPGTTIGPHCKVGGEVNNSIFMAYSNKGHDGFLGNSVIGEWCNLGADTNTSNLKNNYSGVRVWDYSTQKYLDTGLQFCGLVMGDFSKSAISTRFNTGTVVGISANIFTADFPPKFIPSFSWGGEADSERFNLEKCYESAQKMMERRKEKLTENEKKIVKHIYLKHTEY